MKRMLLLHRWVLGITDKTGYRFVVDHIDRDRMNCTRANLRTVSPAESNLNRRVAKRDLPLGVYLTRHGKYEAKLQRNRSRVYLGTFDTAEEAEAAVRRA